jgi:hypothetical protein
VRVLGSALAAAFTVAGCTNLESAKPDIVVDGGFCRGITDRRLTWIDANRGRIVEGEGRALLVEISSPPFLSVFLPDGCDLFCKFSAEQAAKVERVRNGNIIRVRGKIVKAESSGLGGPGVTLDPCIVVGPP